MARNEFGVESNAGGGFSSFGGSNNIEDMLAEAADLSVADDEISEEKSSSFGRRRNKQSQPVREREETPAPSSFGGNNDFEDMFNEAANLSVEEDDDVEEAPQHFDMEQDGPVDDSFENSFTSDPISMDEDETEEYEAAEPTTNTFQNPDSFAGFENDKWSTDQQDDEPIDGGYYATDEVAPVEPEQVIEAPKPVPVPEPVRPVADLDPTFVPVSERKVAPAPVEEVQERYVPPMAPTVSAPVAVTESDVDYIEKVILTSDAIRDLPEEDGKAANILITGGVPVGTHQELVLAALLADRQILKTADAVLDAKSKGSVDRAFYILGLDERTFEEFGKMISNDLDASETVLFDGDRLRYARKLVDVVEGLTDGSIKRFEAVQSVLQAGELSD